MYRKRTVQKLPLQRGNTLKVGTRFTELTQRATAVSSKKRKGGLQYQKECGILLVYLRVQLINERGLSHMSSQVIEGVVNFSNVTIEEDIFIMEELNL